jgi:ABC-type Fe3+-siderophore transport system permease subunit
VSIGAFVVALALGAALLAIWAVVRFPRMGPETLMGALVQVSVAFLSGLILVPLGMQSALGWHSTIGPLAAVFVFALPGLLYLFLASLWAMRVLQQMMSRARR